MFLSEEEIKEYKTLANEGKLEVVKKDLISMQFQVIMGLKNAKLSNEEKLEKLTMARLLDNIMIRIDSYKDTKIYTKEVNGKTIETDKARESSAKLGEWLRDNFIQSFNN